MRRILLAAVTLASLAALARPARAQSAAELLQQGITAFALAQFEVSRQALERARAATRDPRLLARISLYLGLNAAVIGSTGSAREAFTQALTFDPALTLDARSVKRELVQLFEEVRASLKGELRVRSSAPPARVLVDGKQVGTLPLTTKLPVGPHTLEVRSADGRSSFRTEVLVRPRDTSTVVAELRPPQGLITVRSEPPGAEVLLDGKRLGRSPVTRAPVDAGNHELEVRLVGHHARLQRVTVQPAGHARLSMTLTRTPQGAPRPTPGRRRRLWTWITAGGAVAALAAGIGVAAASSADYDEWTRDCSESYWAGRCDELQARVRDKDLAANILFGVAGGLAATSVALFFLEGYPWGETRTAARLSPGPGGLALDVSF